VTLRRAAPGPQLSSGRLRVDAGKAIAKLREYQLADRSAWVLEAIRAAVAAKATRIELSGDTNDVWLAWDGEPWPDEVLPRLFDELVSPEAASENHHVRLLAAAVNSALGMEPAYVDVTSIHDGSATRVRYKPEILVEPTSELGESTLRHVATEPVPVPAGATRGMRVHVRRRLGDWRVFSEAPELGLARDACRDIAVPLYVDDLVLLRDGARDVVRVPLGEGVDGFIAITDVERASTTAVLEVAERGAILAEYEVDLIDGYQNGRVPIRVYVDAPRMPTNASRSQVRRDAHPIDLAEKRAHALIPVLIAELRKAVEQGSERARTSALALLAAYAGGPRWHVGLPSLRGVLRELAQLALVKNAVGQPRALTSHWRAEVHLGGTPFDGELAPWLEQVLWAPAGDPARQLVQPSTVDTRGMRRLVRYARRQLRAQRQFLAHQKRDVRVSTSAAPHVRAPLGIAVSGSTIPDQPFEGLTGEICIYARGHLGALVVLLDGRELERIEFDSPFAFDAVIDSSRVTPADRYRGVKRDAEYQRVERAMRAGLVRALEALALAKRDPDDAELDGRLFRRGIGVIREVGAALRGPLATAPAYPTTTNRWVSVTDLMRETTIGVTPPNSDAVVPAGRVVVVLDESERRALAEVVQKTVVLYRRIAAARFKDIAMGLAAQYGGALIVREPGITAAIAPSKRAELRVYHVGMELETRGYSSSWLDCAIAIDCDAIVPDTDWTQATDLAGLDKRSYADWEAALLRAIACAVIREPAPDLLTNEVVELDSKLGGILCRTLVRHGARELLGRELYDKLRNAKLLHVLGSLHRCSIAEVAEQSRGAISYIEQDALAVAGFTPVVAPKHVVAALAKLVDREIVDASPTLERHRREAARARNLAQHREQRPQPIAISTDDYVSLPGPKVRGVVGAWDGPFEIHVFVERRRFAILHPPDSELPLVAAVEIDEQDCDDTFELLTHETRRVIQADVRDAIPALLVEIAAKQPHKLGDVGPVRRLLASSWVSNDKVKQALRAAPAFNTIQGGRASLASAAQPRLIVSVASWVGDWLGPDGESPHALDEPVLFAPGAQSELAKVIDKLHDGAVVDVTEDVTRLQARRRIARGLVPMPRVADALPELKRSLADLGVLGKQLGIGEIALVEQTGSSVTHYVDGRHTNVEMLDVLPYVAVAVQLNEPHPISAEVQKLTELLVKQVIAAVKLDSLPPRIQRNLMRAALARRIDHELLRELTLWRDFLAQHDRYGDVWVVLEATDLKPLDEHRRVFFFERATFNLAQTHNWNVILARKDLELDAVARTNLARRPARSLELTATGVLAEQLLAGDGTTSPRGVVGVLSPQAYAVAQRGVRAHREMHPFDISADPCRWPTIAVIDDARLTPDRTWSTPQQDDVWQSIAKELRVASERALDTLCKPPFDALVDLRVTSSICADVSALRKATKTVVRGVLWFEGAPNRRTSIRINDRNGARSFTPNHPFMIGGTLFVYAPDNVDIELALQQLCFHAHGKLVRALVTADTLDHDLVAAHVAHALALRTVRATDVRGVEFKCFSPRPLDSRALTSLLRGDTPVVAIRPGTAPDPNPEVIELVDDGSGLANTIIGHLGERVRRSRPAPKPRPARETQQVVKPHIEAAKPKPAPKPKPPEPPHALTPLVKRLRMRLSELGIGGYQWSIIERTEPMFAYADEIEVAGDNIRLRALAAALLANSPLADAGIDVVVAHLVTVLNVALTQITDASEAHALGLLLTSPPSASPPRSRQSS
jgi:hypothetical protein